MCCLLTADQLSHPLHIPTMARSRPMALQVIEAFLLSLLVFVYTHSIPPPTVLVLFVTCAFECAGFYNQWIFDDNQDVQHRFA